MTAGTDALKAAFRLYNVDGVPASGENEPDKGEILPALDQLSLDIAAAQAGITIVADTAARDTFFADAENQGKLVYVNDNNGAADDPANGVYEYVDGAARLAEGFYQGLATAVQPLVDEAEAAAALADASAQSVLDVRDMLMTSQHIGPSTVDDGTTSASGTVTFGRAIAKDGKGVRVEYFGEGTGTAYIQIVSRSGDINTIVAEESFAVTAGAHTVDFPALEFTAGQYVGFRAVSGLISLSSGIGTGFDGYWSTGSAITEGNSYTDAATSNGDFKIAIDLFSPGLNATEFAAVSTQVGSNDPDLDTIALPVATTPVTGSAVGTSTYVFAHPAPVKQSLTAIRAFVLTAGFIVLRRYTFDGVDTFTKVGSDVLAELSATGSITVSDGLNFTLEAGEYLGIQNGTASYALTSGVTGHPFYTGPSDGASFVDSATTNSIRFEIGFDFEPVSLTQRVRVLEESMEGGVGATAPASFIVVWGLGESHMAGRSTVLSPYELDAGYGYNYRRATTSLASLADPTGNDATAISGSGRGTFGPALGDTVVRASGGSTGVLLVNSGLGSTTIGFQWADGGTAWTQAVTDLANAFDAAHAAKLSISGIVVALNIGTNDAAAGTDPALFKTRVLDLFTRCKDATSCDNLKMVIAQTGTDTGGDTASYQAIRQAQIELTQENPDILMGWTKAKYLAATGGMIDTVHMGQNANDDWGRSFGPVVMAAGLGVYPSGIDS